MLNDIETLEAKLISAAERGGAHVVESLFRHFEPHGVSGVVILAESHLAIHTWPELGCAAVDIFTCGSPEIAEGVGREIIEALAPGGHHLRRMERGPLRESLESKRAV